jgi:hypothetical protein
MKRRRFITFSAARRRHLGCLHTPCAAQQGELMRRIIFAGNRHLSLERKSASGHSHQRPKGRLFGGSAPAPAAVNFWVKLVANRQFVILLFS